MPFPFVSGPARKLVLRRKQKIPYAPPEADMLYLLLKLI